MGKNAGKVREICQSKKVGTMIFARTEYLQNQLPQTSSNLCGLSPVIACQISESLTNIQTLQDLTRG